MKKIKYHFLGLILCLILISSCNKESGLPEKQPSVLDANWVAFEIQVSDVGAQLNGPFDLVTSVDPNNDSTIIIDNLYDAGLRIKAPYDSVNFEVVMAEQIEKNNTRDKQRAYISVRGYVSDDSPLISYIYSLAANSYENIAFTENDIEDIIFMRIGYYDKYKLLLDSVMLMGYRKTGFEEENY